MVARRAGTPCAALTAASAPLSRSTTSTTSVTWTCKAAGRGRRPTTSCATSPSASRRPPGGKRRRPPDRGAPSVSRRPRELPPRTDLLAAGPRLLHCVLPALVPQEYRDGVY